MFTNRSRIVLVAIFALVFGILSPGFVQAQTPTGTGPGNAMLPTNEWKELKVGDSHWYTFRFDYDEVRAGEPIEVRLYSEPLASAVLTLHNQEQAELWRRDGKQEHFGCCTLVQDDKNNDGKPDFALWSGALRTTGNYYIVVEPARNVTPPLRYRFEISGKGISCKDFSQPIYYSFTLKGEGVSFSAVAAQPVQTVPVAPLAAAVVVEAQPEAVTSLAGTGPDYAMRPTDEWRTVQAGEHQWFAFRFAYDEKRAGQPIEIRIYSDPFDGAVLTVRNSEQAEKWRKDGVHEHFGCCTLVDQDVDKDGKPDFALWSGALRVSGTYYIVVEHASQISGPVHYHFTISGEGVLF